MGLHGIAPRKAVDDGEIHKDLGWQLNLVFWILTSLATIFLALRVYCKFLRGRKLWWDDHFLIASWVRWQDPPP